MEIEKINYFVNSLTQTSMLHTSKASSYYVLLWHRTGPKKIKSPTRCYFQESRRKKEMFQFLGFGGDVKIK